MKYMCRSIWNRNVACPKLAIRDFYQEVVDVTASPCRGLKRQNREYHKPGTGLLTSLAGVKEQSPGLPSKLSTPYWTGSK